MVSLHRFLDQVFDWFDFPSRVSRHKIHVSLPGQTAILTDCTVTGLLEPPDPDFSKRKIVQMSKVKWFKGQMVQRSSRNRRLPDASSVSTLLFLQLWSHPQ